jgi:hypothetical protein
MTKKNQKLNCPLCGSLLSEMKYYEIIGAWDQRARAEKEIKEKLHEAERQTKEIIAKQKNALKQLERQKKLEIKQGVEKGKQKEMARANRLSQMVQRQTADLQNAQGKIRELERHLKAGTTPQDAGRDFEKELVKQLQKEFPSDKIEHHGKAGDILQKVIFKSKEVGCILYECKKTTKFNPDFIHQTKRAIITCNATYGVLVTFVSKKNAQGFYVENDIIVVHPYGTVHIAQVLRNAILEMHSLRLTHKQLGSRAQSLMEFIKSNDFKNSVENTIYRTQELAKLLMMEYKEHKKMWEKRFLHYNGIHDNTNHLQMATRSIINGIPVNKRLIKADIKQLQAPGFNNRKNGA